MFRLVVALSLVAAASAVNCTCGISYWNTSNSCSGKPSDHNQFTMSNQACASYPEGGYFMVSGECNSLGLYQGNSECSGTPYLSEYTERCISSKAACEQLFGPGNKQCASLTRSTRIQCRMQACTFGFYVNDTRCGGHGAGVQLQDDGKCAQVTFGSTTFSVILSGSKYTVWEAPKCDVPSHTVGTFDVNICNDIKTNSFLLFCPPSSGKASVRSL